MCVLDRARPIDVKAKAEEGDKKNDKAPARSEPPVADKSFGGRKACSSRLHCRRCADMDADPHIREAERVTACCGDPDDCDADAVARIRRIPAVGTNSTKRKAAYQQLHFMLRTADKRGSDERQPHSTCALLAIRTRWPDATYMGFKDR